MQGLYERVIKGEFSAIQPHYSKDLRFIIRQLLQIEPAKRPSCEKILRMQAVQRHLVNYIETNEPNVLISRIKIKDHESMSESLPAPNYSSQNISEMPTMNKSPSKSFRLDINRSFAIKDKSYSNDYRSNYKDYRDIIKESYGALKLPKIRYLGKQSPQPIRKLRDIEEYFSMPKSLPANDRLKKLRDAYLAKPIKLFIN